MDTYRNFEGLDAFYSKVAQASNFHVDQNKSLIINTEIDFLAFNYVRFNSLDQTFWKQTLHSFKVPFLAFPNQSFNEDMLKEWESKWRIVREGDVIAHRYKNLQDFKFTPKVIDLKIKIVVTAQEIDHVDLISSQALGHPRGYMAKFIKGFATPQLSEGFYAFVAYLDGEPVGQSFLSIHNGVPGLYFDSVLPAYRKRGIETEMAQARMAFARDRGYDQIVVQCMASSVNLFQRLGFVPEGKLMMHVCSPSKE